VTTAVSALIPGRAGHHPHPFGGLPVAETAGLRLCPGTLYRAKTRCMAGGQVFLWPS
jgi:hypothetical protein